MYAAEPVGMRRPDVFADIHVIPPEHKAVDAELAEWGSWLRLRRWSADQSPMFRLFRSSETRAEYGALTAEPTPQAAQAMQVEAAVRALPDLSRAALRGWYFRQLPPWRLARDLGIRKVELQQVLDDARACVDALMWPNRKPSPLFTIG